MNGSRRIEDLRQFPGSKEARRPALVRDGGIQEALEREGRSRCMKRVIAEFARRQGNWW